MLLLSTVKGLHDIGLLLCSMLLQPTRCTELGRSVMFGLSALKLPLTAANMTTIANKDNSSNPFMPWRGAVDVERTDAEVNE